jgi:perosamine synthetase
VSPNEFDNKFIISLLKKKGIECRPFFTPMNLQPVYKKLGFFKKQKMKNSEYLSKKGFYIPSGIGTSDSQIKIVCKEIISIFNKYK